MPLSALALKRVARRLLRLPCKHDFEMLTGGEYISIYACKYCRRLDVFVTIPVGKNETKLETLTVH